MIFLQIFRKAWFKQLAGILLSGVLSATAIAASPTIDHKLGGSVAIKLRGLPGDAQIALVPGGPHPEAGQMLKSPAQAMARNGTQVFVAAGESGLLIFDDTPASPPHLLAQIKGKGQITRVALHGKHAYLADSTGALLIVDVQNPRQPQQIAAFTLGRPVDALCAEQDRVYWVSGKYLGVLNVSNPQAPQQIAGFALSGAASAVQADNGYAYLALPQAGLSIVDARDPSNMREAGYFRGEVWGLAVAQGRAYLANGALGLTVLDISEPQAPHWLGSVNRIGKGLALSYDDGYVALHNERAEITLIDARNPQLMKIIAAHPVGHSLNAIALAQKRVLAAADTGLEVIDFSAPMPDVVSIGANFGGSRRAVIRDNILYVADWFSGLHLYDISEPASPRHLAAYHTQGSSKGVLIDGDHAFVADDDHGVQIIDISSPKQPRKISEVATPGLAYTTRLAGDYLYLADHRGGFHIISVADIAHPAIIGSAPTAGKAWSLEVVGNMAYVAADDAGLLVFDVSDPQRPIQIFAHDVGGAAEDIVIRDHLAYVASFENGLHIFDLGDPAQPREIGYLATPGNARGIELDGHIAYIADWTSGVQVVDIADPEQPVLIGAYDTDGWSWGVRVHGQYAYVLDWWGGITVLDISNPAVPILAGAYHERGVTMDVAVKDSRAYVADGKNGLQIFDVKTPQNPIWMAGVDMAGDAQSVWLEDRTVYVATGANGVVAVDASNPFEPQQLRHYTVQADLVRAQGDLVFAAGRHGVAIIDAPSGQQAARYAAEINDMWPAADGRLLLATLDGVEIVEMADPTHPRLAERLPHHASLVRSQKNLLALYDKATGISLYDYATKKLLGHFNPGEEISGMQISGDRLYASGSLSGLLVLDISNTRRPVLKAVYPAASRTTRLSEFSGAVFMAGNETLASVRLLPDVTVKQDRNGSIRVSAPPKLPLGSYHLLAINPKNGKRTMRYDALRVVMPASKTPRFNMQDLERAMRERGLNPASHQ